MSVATVTSKGQVTIQKDVREALGIRHGDRLEFVVREDGSVSVRPLRVDIRDLFGVLRADRKVSVGEMSRVIAEGWTRKGRRR